MPEEQIKTSISLFQQDERIINQISTQTGIRDRSGCIRFALTYWARHNLISEQSPTVLVDTPAEYVTK